jgi:tetratricopeptide (TPR) repeat protein
LAEGQWPQAAKEFRTALQLKPDDSEINKAFAAALAERGDLTAAINHLRAAVRREADLESLIQLGGWLQQAGQVREAIASYRRALDRDPNSFDAMNNLAWLLATSADASLRNGPEAVRLAESAVRSTQSRQAIPLGTLAAAYAEAGRFEEAVATAERAIQVATAAGNKSFADLNRQLLGLYRARRPYHEPEVRSPKSEGRSPNGIPNQKPQ